MSILSNVTMIPGMVVTITQMIFHEGYATHLIVQNFKNERRYGGHYTNEKVCRRQYDKSSTGNVEEEGSWIHHWNAGPAIEDKQ